MVLPTAVLTFARLVNQAPASELAADQRDGDNGGVRIVIKVLGPVQVTDLDGRPIAIGSQRRREVLGRLVVADGRAVPLESLVNDLWPDPPHTAVGSVRTFISELRGALEPDRSPRNRSHLIETVGSGYALRVERAQVDAHHFEDALRTARDADPGQAAETLNTVLAGWAGEPFADLDTAPWVLRERTRLGELRLQAIEVRAAALLDLGRGEVLIPELDTFATSHPWRERAWILLSQALYQADRQVDALSSLRGARTRLLDRFGLDSAPGLDRLEGDILRHAPQLSPAPQQQDRLRLLTRTEATGTYTRLRSMSTVAGAAALTGGTNLRLAQAQRAAAVAEAERRGDPELTARVITAYEVPAIWTRSDDEAQAEVLVDTARRTLRQLPPQAPVALRSRLLATMALEHRGSRDRWATDAAAEAEQLARELGDPSVLALALNARFVQSFQRQGRTGERDTIASELITLAARHDLPAFEILGHLIKIQTHAASGNPDQAQRHVDAAEQLARVHETPAVRVLTGAFLAMRRAGQEPAEAAYRAVASELAGAGMPGIEAGFLPLAILSVRLRHQRPAPTDPALDWGPYRPWVQPLLHLAGGNVAAARRATAGLPDPRADHLYDALWAITAHTAIRTRDDSLARRVRDALEPLRGEIAGGTTAMITFGPVDDLLAGLDDGWGQQSR
jgi:DNA-binding SARP family transcriptional activator